MSFTLFQATEHLPSNYLLSDFHVSGIHCKLYAYVRCRLPWPSLMPTYSVKSPTGGVIVSCQASHLTRIRPHIPHTSPGYVKERHQGQRGSLQAHVGHPHARRRTQYSGIAKFVNFPCRRAHIDNTNSISVPSRLERATREDQPIRPYPSAAARPWADQTQSR